MDEFLRNRTFDELLPGASAFVIATDEEQVIAEETFSILGGTVA
ncbi:hypothetical protein [Shinella sp.]